MSTRHFLGLFLVAACQASTATQTGFGSTPVITTVSTVSTGEGSTSSSGTSTSEASGSGSSVADTSTEPPRDLGVMPDFGDDAPIGCNGRIDLLFVISRESHMRYRQEQLAVAFPHFIATIESMFADFDYHIMVVTGDEYWGSDTCTQMCPTPACKIGEPCCPLTPNGDGGELCCGVPDYPCDKLDLVTLCDRTWGAGEVFPAGYNGAANKPCPVDGDRRYLAKGQSDLEGTFECIARVGTSGYGMLGQALTAAMQKTINEPGGCNGGFLRDDALLMVTFIASGPDSPKLLGSEGSPAEWAKAVIDAKHGDDRSVVMFNIGGCDCGPHEGECHPHDRLCVLTTMFPYHHQEDALVPDYGPAFVQAASLVETACAGFTPPPG